MKLGSLFDGIGGFPLVASRYKIKPVWASEIEPWPIKVTQKHFPNMKHLGDITQVNGAEIEPVDIITFGSPCTRLSVAGKHDGFDINFECQGNKDSPHEIYSKTIRATDKYQYEYTTTCPVCGQVLFETNESALFFHAIRVIREMRDATNGTYPRFAVWENVPGAFSSNKGEDIQVVLDELEKCGFVIDLNVLDAQYMGVPQRRRRIFALCVSADFIRQMRTPTSLSIITQLLMEILLCALSEQLNLYEKEPKNLVWGQRKLTADGLQRKMKLFSIGEKQAFEKLLENWIEICQTLLSGQFSWVNPLGVESNITIKADTFKKESPMEMALDVLFGNISRLWKELLGDLYYQENSCITLTATKETMNRIICGCASLLENIALLTAQLKNYCPISYETELYISTARKVCINYARERQTSITLFDGVEWLQCWDDYIRLHTETEQQFERYIGNERRPEVFPFTEGLRGDTAESGEAREEIAADAERGVGTAVCYPINTQIITRHNKLGRNTGFGLGKEGDPAYTLQAGHEHGVVAPIAIDSNCQDSRFKLTGQVVPTIPAKMGTGGNNGPMLAIPIHDKATRYKGGGPTRKNDGAANGFGVGKPGDVMPTLGTGDRHAVAFQPGNLSRQAGAEPSTEVFPTLGAATLGDQFPHVAFGVDCRNLYENDELSATIQAKPNGGQSLNYINPVRQGYAVRRLTPTECLRLQGYPDWWLDVEGMSDSAKYRAIGNSVAIPCVESVLGGIVEALSCK